MRHVLVPGELTVPERHELFDTLLDFQQRIITNVSTGCDIRQNFRPFIKQNQLKIDHVHFHLLPRTLEDEMFHKVQVFERELFSALPEEEPRLFAKLLKK
jgi:diadenosine tetraphosphate (Ap4A) HIT family hydrolase